MHIGGAFLLELSIVLLSSTRCLTVEELARPLILLIIFQILFMGVPFHYTAVAGSGKVGPVNRVNHTSWVAVVTPTDRPKSVRNRCVIDFFFVWCCLCCHFALLTFLLV